MSDKDPWLDTDLDDAPESIRARILGVRKRRRGIRVVDLLQALLVGTLLYVALSFIGSKLKVEPEKATAPLVLQAPAQELLPAPVTASLTEPGLQPDQRQLPRPLDECLNGGSSIDEGVVRCRYGHLPRQIDPAPNSGMVSPEYLAHFQQRKSSGSAGSSASIENTAVWIDRWGGGGRYFAEWTSRNNRIDYRSVCANHKRGSIDYRECRKAAKQHFHQQCRAWAARWQGEQHAHSKRMQTRYCSASSGFSPTG